MWLTHRLVARPGAGTLRAGQGRVEFDPAFVLALPERALREVLRLEALRILLEHPYRRRTVSAPEAWLASNITLAEHARPHLKLPRAREVFGAADHDKQYYEYYCARLRERGGGGGGGEPPGEGAAEDAARAAGGGGTGDDPMARHLNPAAGREQTALWGDDALAVEEIAAAVREATLAAAWGSVGGTLRARVVANLQPRVDYRRVLRQLRTSILSSRRELTRMRPSRRYGFTHMGSRRPLTTRLLIAVDVSGSMSEREVAEAFSVVRRVFRYGIETLDVIQFDTRVTGPPLTLTRGRPRYAIAGRGGTDFAPVMAFIDAHRDYDGLIVITDGEAPAPPRPSNRHTRVVWLFNSEVAYRRSRERVAHVGRAAFIKAG